MTERSAHLPELDRLKGFAIICVVCIHAKLYAETLFHEHVINRAVPIFVVLFGVTSELWWARASKLLAGTGAVLKDWYLRRLERLVVPFWAMAVAWWVAALVSGSAAVLAVGWPHAIVTFAGYAPWIGTTWFVTIILELVVVYPALRWMLNRLGAVLGLGLAAALCAVSVWYFWQIIEVGLGLFGEHPSVSGFYYFWIFSPRMFWHVVAGMVLARRCAGRPNAVLTALALVLAVLGVVLQHAVKGPPEDLFYAPLRQQMVAYLFDVPLAIGLLGAFRWLPLPEVVGRGLAWCGVFSWGIYLAHLLVHELVHMAGHAPETDTQAVRAAYAAFLLVSGAAVAAAADWLWRRARSKPPRSGVTEKAGRAGQLP